MTLSALDRLLARASQVVAIGALACAITGCSVDPPDAADDDESAETDADALSTNSKTAYEFFVAKGLKNYQAAAIVGNLLQESSVDPGSVQYGGGPGRGIAQWSKGGRWDHDAGDNVKAFAAQRGESMTSLHLQLEFVWFELKTFSYFGLSSLKSAVGSPGTELEFAL